MRTFALAAMAALFALSPTGAGAWTAETGQQATNGANLADPDEQFKALQDKVNAKSQSTSGFFISGGVESSSDNAGFQPGPGSAIVPGVPGYMPSAPGFRAR